VSYSDVKRTVRVLQRNVTNCSCLAAKWNELRVVYDNILRDYGKRLQEDKDKKQAGST